ncbi:MAG TPA: hypothetical protein ENG51_03785 [Deltaproteobacteria bacterium]|nr:hypothetical protein [Deltaproteobacteria bacterium]
MDRIPLITLTISTIKNVRRVIKQDKDIPTALEHIACDTAAVGVGGWAGSKIGFGIGLALAPATGGVSAIIIPTVTTIAGTLSGIIAGKKIVTWFKQRHLRAAINHLKLVASDFRQSFLRGYDRILAKVEEYYRGQILKIKQAYRKNEGFFKRTFFPSTLSKFYQMAISRARKEWRDLRKYYEDLRKKLFEMESQPKSEEIDNIARGGLLIYAQGKAILNGDKELLEKYDEVDKAIKKVEEEKRKLK